jgi:hypothetical protein
MSMIRIDKEMLIEDILAIRALVPVENDDARDRIDKLISLISNLPNDEKKSQFPKSSIRRL